MNYAPAKKYLALFALYIVLALVLTYPLAFHFNTHIPGHDTDGPAQTWSLWWTRYAMLDLGRAPFTTDYIFYPLGLNLVAYTPVFLNGVLSIPLQFVFGVVVAQNLMVLFALVSGAFGAYLFTREILLRSDFFAPRSAPNVPHAEMAAVLAGALYGFGAWHLNYVVAGHFMLISNQWLPFYALYLLRLDRGKRRDALMLALFLILTAWTELTFVPFLAILTIFYLVYLLLAQRAALRSTLLGLVLTTLVAAIGMLPLVLSLASDFQRYGYYLTSGVGRIQIFSAELVSFFLPSGQHPFLGAWSESITTANTSYAFIGWAVIVLVLVGLVARRASSFARFWFIAGVLFALLMLGSTLYVNGENTNLPMPFAMLRLITFVNANRYPARFNVMLMLALLPLFAWGILALWNARTAYGKYALVALVVLLVVEQLVLPIPLTDVHAAPIYETIANEAGDFALLELPLGWRGSIVMQGETDDVAQFFQTTDHKRRLGGITSRFPDFKLRYYDRAPVLRSLIALEEGRTVDDAQRARDLEAVQDVLRFFDIRYVSVHRAQTSPETLAYLQATLPLQEIASDAERVMYRVGSPPPVTRLDVDPASEFAQLLFDDSWGHAQEDNAGFGYRWAMDGSSRLWLPLERADYDLTFRLRGTSSGQKVTLRVNDLQVTEWNVTDQWSEYPAHIPAFATRDGLDELVFTTTTTPLDKLTNQDRTIGSTGIVSPVDISVVGAGFDAGKYGEIYVAGRSLVPSTRGYHLVAINPQTGAVDSAASFDTFADDTASQRLADFVAALPQGEIVAGVAVDDASQKFRRTAFNALQSLGVAGDIRGQFRAGHAFIGIKGVPPGQAVEDLNALVPASAAIGNDVTKPFVAFALGPFQILR